MKSRQQGRLQPPLAQVQVIPCTNDVISRVRVLCHRFSALGSRNRLLTTLPVQETSHKSPTLKKVVERLEPQDGCRSAGRRSCGRPWNGDGRYRQHGKLPASRVI
ncbi:hypothetical protein Y032_0089g2208 [Ancylostoma ceylanicum]|uniref:Uncharacterized protein n=1 Tax=Ancylostoma ceylanicum TaxID=53326 RepID=A0A016TN28_9BILA|nr:hypothetical protein Y032_0089g2208 [Ancylostoma ceylanicum]